MDEPLLSECFKLVSLLEKKVFRSLNESVLDNDLTISLWCYVYLTKIIVSFDFSGVILMSFWLRLAHIRLSVSILLVLSNEFSSTFSFKFEFTFEM